MRREHRKAQLYLNGQPVGEVSAEAASDGWGFGHFNPSPGFSLYAPLFGTWSILLHMDDDSDRASPAALDELRATEMAIDQIKAELHWAETGQRTSIRQLTIDGTLIEWNLGSPSSRY